MEIDPRYLAGLFDGEGCIRLTVHGRNRQVALDITIVNTDEKLLTLVQQNYGGSTSTRPHKAHPEWKPFRAIHWRHNDAANLLYAIRPYSIVKARQIALALEFWDFQHSEGRLEPVLGHSGYGGPTRRRTSEAIARELDFKQRMHELNRKGAA